METPGRQVELAPPAPIGDMTDQRAAVQPACTKGDDGGAVVTGPAEWIYGCPPRQDPGGEPGAPGENWPLPNGDEFRADRLPDKRTVRLRAGDVLRMLTPGGDGWGLPAAP
jgi:Hydantoinase B/oxoprolinase